MTSVTFTFIVAVVSLLGRTFGHYCKTFVDSTVLTVFLFLLLLSLNVVTKTRNDLK